MACSAHQRPEDDDMKTFNCGYLATVAALLLSWNSLLAVKVLTTDDMAQFWCERFSGPTEILKMIPASFFFLAEIVIILISLRINRILESLQPEHLENLPSRNALTFRDTQILYSLLSLQFVVISSVSSLYPSSQFQTSLLTKVVLHLCFDNVIISFLFPIYIIVKTKRYLPKLWDDSSQLIHGNNDFYAENPSQVSPEP